jgi:ABC-type dipeptide/oligopeptide/nickel transport system permease component
LVGKFLYGGLGQFFGKKSPRLGYGVLAMYHVFFYRSKLWVYFVERVLIAVVSFFVITFLFFNWICLTVSPSDLYVPHQVPDELSGLSHEMLTELYIPERSTLDLYGIWIRGFFTGKLGYSLVQTK